MGRGSSKVGGSGGGGAGATQPKTKRQIQIDNLEQKWGGSGKALHPEDLKVGDTISGIQYFFSDDALNPDEKKGSWSGDMDGVKMKFSANNSFVITSIKKTPTSIEIEGNKVGGAGGTVKKKIKVEDNLYFRTWQG